MVNWTSAIELDKESKVYGNVIFAFFGVYVWELLFQNSDFEWSLLTRQRRFTWPLVFPFFLCRYAMLGALIGLIISLQPPAPINCKALYIFISVSGNLAILNASTSLMIRTIALWERQLTVVIPLCLLCLAHWAILCRSMFIVSATYDPTTKLCTVWYTDHVFLNVEFFMTMGFDFVILIFTIVALYVKHRTCSDLWHLLFRDGLLYFVVTFLCNALPAVFTVLNLNTIMNIIATIPAATIASIAACRLVIRLQRFNPNEAISHISAAGMSECARSPLRLTQLPSRRYTMPRRPEVLVTTDHYVMEDFTPTPMTVSPTTPISELKRSMVLEIDRDADDKTDFDSDSTRSVSTKVKPPSLSHAV